MSLTSHIADPASVLSRLLAHELPDLAAWRADLRTRVPKGRTAVPWPEAGRPPYSTLGHAIDGRLRLALSENALHCCFYLAFARKVTDAMLLSGLRHPLPADIEPLIATGGGVALQIVSPAVEAGRRVVGRALVRVLLDAAELCRRTGPWERDGLLLDESAEDALCRAIYVGAWLEESGRSGRLPPESALARLIAVATEMGTHRPDLVVELVREQALGEVPDAAVADMRALIALASEAGWDKLRERTPIMTGPSFSGSHLVGAADADVIAGGLIIDIKTTVEPGRAKSEDLKQLLGYLLLDTDDAFGVEALGLYLARQGLLVTWDVGELFRLLGATKSLPQLRSELVTRSERARAAPRI